MPLQAKKKTKSSSKSGVEPHSSQGLPVLPLNFSRAMYIFFPILYFYINVQPSEEKTVQLWL